MTRRVLILGSRAPVALDHARRFRQQGWQVHIADSSPCRLTSFSASVHANHAVAPPRYAPQQFGADLARIVDEQRIDLLLPTCEEALHLSRIRAALPATLKVAVDHFEVLAALHSKWEFLTLARRHGMPVPHSARVLTLGEAREWSNGRPVVLKPEFSRFGVHVRLYPRGLPANALALAGTGPWLVQELLEGDELCSYAIADRGRLRAHVAYRPNYRLGRSASYYFEPTEHDGIRAAVRSLVAGLGYSGQLSFDWIVGPDGVARALECNPRATSGLHLFPMEAALPAALAGQEGACVADMARPRMIATLMLGPGLRHAWRRGRMAQWRVDWLRATDVIATNGDVAPLAGALADLAGNAALALRAGCGLREAATRDIEWDGEALEAIAS